MTRALRQAAPARTARRVAAVAVVLVLCVGSFALGSLPVRRSAAPGSVAHQPVQSQCFEGAALFHDVLWAAACSALAQRGKGDGHAECELPPDEAGKLNRMMQQAEQRCASEPAGARSLLGN